MKKLLCVLMTLILVQVMFPQESATAQATTDSDFRAVWVSTVLNLDFPSKQGLTNQEMKKEIDTIINRSSDIGLNAIVLQVRPNGDAIYKSDIFPWSNYITGVQGKAPADGFDPLTYWIEQAHNKGIELHAWINPYRITHTAQKITDTNKLADTNPARKNTALAVPYNGALYYDPGLPESRQLIIDGVTEIIKKYSVDGIHFDDYFYPGADFSDDKTYAKYGAGANRSDWRRENVNELIKGVQKAIKETAPHVSFGISPAGIWQNKSSDPLGSDTRGFEAYKSIYSDSRRWVKEGWLDYICPQIYWYVGFDVADYQKLLNWWQEVCRGTSVDLYIGHAAYNEDEKKDKWSGEIVRQLQLNAKSDVVRGSIFFRSSHLVGNVGTQIKNYYATTPSVPVIRTFPESPITSSLPPVEIEAPVASTAPPVASTTPPVAVQAPPVVTEAPPAGQNEASVKMDKLMVVQPSSATATVAEGSGYYIFGSANPDKALFMNGVAVENRTIEGFFSVYVPLQVGQNVFTFTQENQETITRTITLKAPVVSTPQTLKTAAISNPSPATDEHVSVGDTVTLKCTAPAGAEVSVTFNGETVPLNSSNTNKGDGSAIYAATYSYQYKITSQAAKDKISNLGAPIYKMTYNGKESKASSDGKISLIGEDVPYYATVIATSAWMYPTSTTNGGSSLLLLNGQKDRITAMTGAGKWVRLASGGWMEKANVSCKIENSLVNNPLTEGVYVSGDNTDTLKWKSSSNTVLNTSLDGKDLTIYFGMHKDVPKLDIPALEGTVFSAVTNGTDNGKPFYRFTIKDSAFVEGYYTEFVNGELKLNIKKRRSLVDSDKPLEGFTFVVDAGHGFDDSGAKGPMGSTMTEKDINLINALKLSERLEDLGATVIKVRDKDVFYTLYQRIEISRNANPDMFLSIHGNSMAEITDSTNIRGLTVWYRNENSYALADSLMKSLFTINPLTTRKEYPNEANLYVCRPTWTPSVIIETSFLCNIQDYGWLIDDQKQNELADGIVNAILDYYN